VCDVSELRLEVRSSGERHVLELSGELDMANADELEGRLRELCRAGAREITLDLRGLAFIDSTGLRAILEAQQFCRQHGCEYFLIRSDSAMQMRMFEIAGVLERLPFRSPSEIEAIGR